MILQNLQKKRQVLSLAFLASWWVQSADQLHWTCDFKLKTKRISTWNLRAVGSQADIAF
jgi:hypothetical protein